MQKSTEIIRVDTISQIHKAMGLPEPSHPHISLINAADIEVEEAMLDTTLMYNLYSISKKDNSDGILYGRRSYDFHQGTMVFAAPGQLYSPVEQVKLGDMKGWILYFHPNLLRKHSLDNYIRQFNFFNYDVFEALHLSQKEQSITDKIVENIVDEYNKSTDQHSSNLIVSNIELLLKYCQRFYERQFETRQFENNEKLAKFERLLIDHFHAENSSLTEVPDTAFFANQMDLSPHYLSDIIKKETGRTVKEHIDDQVIDRAKNLLHGSEYSISEIAFKLGFNYPQYFTRFFKTKTGIPPKEYRNNF